MEFATSVSPATASCANAQILLLQMLAQLQSLKTECAIPEEGLPGGDEALRALVRDSIIKEAEAIQQAGNLTLQVAELEAQLEALQTLLMDAGVGKKKPLSKLSKLVKQQNAYLQKMLETGVSADE